VARSSRIILSASAASTRYWQANAAPAETAAISGTMPDMWNSGSGSHSTSSGVSRYRSWPRASPVRTTDSCDSTAPLGRAVVPDVYMMRAASRTRVQAQRSRTSPAVTALASISAMSAMPADEAPSSPTIRRSAGAAGA